MRLRPGGGGGGAGDGGRATKFHGGGGEGGGGAAIVAIASASAATIGKGDRRAEDRQGRRSLEEIPIEIPTGLILAFVRVPPSA